MKRYIHGFTYSSPQPRTTQMYTESEMRDIFQRVVDQVATLSTQASQVDGLRARVDELYARVTALEAENASLRSDLTQAKQTISDREADLQNTQAHFDSERAVTMGLRDTIVQRDSRVVELESNLSAERSGHQVTLTERDEARNRVADLEALVQQLRDRITQESDKSAEWERQYVVASQEARGYKTQFERIQAVLAPAANPLAAE